MRVAPGGPFNQEKGLNPVIKANLEKQFHLDEPLVWQYLYYLNDLLHGNLGPSYNLPEFTVNELFAQGLPISVQLGATALLLALVLRLGSWALSRHCNQNQRRRLRGDRHRDGGQHHSDFRHCAADPAGLRPRPQMAAGRRLGRWRVHQQGWPRADTDVAAAGGRRPPDARLDDRVAALASHPHGARHGPFRLCRHHPPCVARRVVADHLLCRALRRRR